VADDNGKRSGAPALRSTGGHYGQTRFSAEHRPSPVSDIGGGSHSDRHRREAEGNPNWRPTWMEGLCIQNQVRKILWEQFYAARRAGSSAD